MKLTFTGVALLFLTVASPGRAQKVNADAQLVEEFEGRITGYVKLRKQVEGTLSALKPTSSQQAIKHHEHELAERLRRARREAVQGNIFTPDIAAEFRRLIGLAMQGKDASHVHQSLQHAEPVRVRIAVNEAYPAGVPLQSTPPTLLMNLPALPPELDYRVVGNNLVLRDAKANLVIDFIPDAIP